MNTEIKKATGKGWTLYHGDCVRVAKTFAADSIGFSVFSPPFADLFTYSADVQDMGNCGGMDEFMQQFSFLIEELHRVTMPGRECAVHCNDLLATKWKDGDIEFKDFSGAIARAFRAVGWLLHSRITIWKDPVTEMQRTKAHGLLYKTLKSDSSKSRTGAPEYLLVFRKRGDNPKPITHTVDEIPLPLWQELASPVWMTIDQSNVLNGRGASEAQDERHICPLQLDVIRRAMMLWSAPDDLVFSPFAGIGSEGYVALQMGRRFVGAELKESYWKTASQNLTGATEQASLFPGLQAA
jgi:DNA modification methylase